jgi:hypothetical protein
MEIRKDDVGQGCQMPYFQTQIPNLGKFFRVFQWKMLVYFTAIWYSLFILSSFGILISRFGIFTKRNLATLMSATRSADKGETLF